MESSSGPKVLVTGFGAFQDIKNNPSWEIVSRLPDMINGVRIIKDSEPLKAVYQSLLEVPKLLEKHNPDVVIHVGLAFDRNYFAIEKGADRDGYHQVPDEARKVVTRAETKARWGMSPARLDTTFNIEDVLAKWKANAVAGSGKGKAKGKEFDLRTSDDVGCYVCGFVYYASLERVLFLHIPDLQGEAEIQRGRDICVALVKAV
ncbi:peptidase C15, pyroglutamyl peptidase I-like protein, partial [Mollisia scopiformis]